MSAFVAHIADLQRKCGRDCLLQGDIPSIQRGKPHFGRQHVGTHFVWKLELSGSWHKGESGCRRPCRKIEHAAAECGGVELLLNQDRQVLRDRVAEYRAKHANVKTPTIT